VKLLHGRSGIVAKVAEVTNVASVGMQQYLHFRPMGAI
jgi:hypothetical protein